MKKLLAIAALLLASTAAQAQYSFEYGGRTIRVDPDRGTVSIPGVYDNSGRRSKRSRNEDGDRDRSRKQQAPQQAKTDPQTPPAEATAPAAVPAEQAPAPAAALPAPVTPSTEPTTTTAAVAPAETAVAPPPPLPPPAASAPVPQVREEPAPAPKPAPAPAVAAVTPPPAPPPAAPQAANSPLGVWLTEEKEGKVRIEQCGANLCGYSVDKKSNQNGEQVLINMKPSKDKWSGRILDPNTGSTYDSTIALKGTDTLRVQGCAFGGVFCGGQTWSRVN